MSAADIATIVGAFGVGGAVQAAITYLKDRRKNVSDANKTDVETKLSYLNAVIERLDDEAKRALSERDRIATELSAEQQRSSELRKRVRELEDHLDEVRRSARETQNMCDDLAVRLKSLIGDHSSVDPLL